MKPRSFLPAMIERGFTLVEAVIVIIITAIVMTGVAIFIQLPVRGYVDSAARADLADTADTALRRMGRDLRLALPNSVRVNTDGSGNYYIEELLTRTGGRYLSQDDLPTTGASGNYLDFYNTSPNPLKFDIVGPLPTGEQTIQAGSDSVVVGNVAQGLTAPNPGNAYETTAGSMNRALIASISGPTITMASNPFNQQVGAGAPTLSQQHRFQVISGPVTYLCNPTASTVTRYWNYTISYLQPVSVATLTTGASAQNALISTGVKSCMFSYALTTSPTSALAILRLQLGSNDSGGSTVELFQQIHIDNTP